MTNGIQLQDVADSNCLFRCSRYPNPHAFAARHAFTREGEGLREGSCICVGLAMFFCVGLAMFFRAGTASPSEFENTAGGMAFAACVAGCFVCTRACAAFLRVTPWHVPAGNLFLMIGDSVQLACPSSMPIFRRDMRHGDKHPDAMDVVSFSQMFGVDTAIAFPSPRGATSC